MEEALVNTYPEGWEKRKTFVDAEGNYYQFGVIDESKKGQFETTQIIKGGKVIYPVQDGNIPPAEGNEPPIETKQATIPTPPAPEKPSDNTDVVRMLTERIAQLENVLMAGQVKQTTVNVKEEKPKFGLRNTESMTADDYTPERKKYHMFGRGYVMGSYVTREGRIVMAPYNDSLYFKKSYDDVRHIDGTNRVIPFCSYETNSKQEMEFIEGHPLYGVLIYSSRINAIQATTNDNMVKLESIVSRIHSLDKMKLYALAHQHGIDINLDESEIRNKIVWIEVEKEYKTEISQQALRRAGSEIDKERVGFSS